MDANIVSVAIKEAVKLNIPIEAILDNNSDPTKSNFPIPGNDDARRSIHLYCEILKDTMLDAKKYIANKQLIENKKDVIKEPLKTKEDDKKDIIKKVFKNVPKKE
jgi:Ribosomal protein S2